jgi:opacity protein-like surface antigen
MNKSFLMLGLSASLLAPPLWSGTMGEVVPVWHGVTAVSLGPVWGHGTRTQTFYLTPEIIKSYVGQNSNNAIFDGELFFGVQRDYPTFQGQLGFAVAATSDAHLSGIIWDDADPMFDNYSYRYRVQHTHFALKGKLLADRGYWLIPWISGSIGVAVNTAHAYREMPLIFEALPTPNFGAHTQASFTYTAGAGVQKQMTQNWQVGVGYEFADWGQSRLNRAAGQTLNSGLRMKHYYTNGVMFNLTCIV